MDFSTILAMALKYGPQALSLIAKYGPVIEPYIIKYQHMVGPLVDKYGPILARNIPAIVQAAQVADSLFGTLKKEGHPAAETMALSSFVGNVAALAPELKQFEPHILSQVQANADAAIRLQSW